MIMQKDIRLEAITCLKILSRIIMSSPMERTFITTYLFGYKKIQLHNWMFVGLWSIWVDIKELDADLKAIQQI